MSDVIIDFDSLPPPQVIEEVKYEEIYASMVARFQQGVPDYGGIFDGSLLESDPVAKVLEDFAYREFLLRQRINAAAQANMLPFAEDADLDMLAAFYGVYRNVVQEQDLTAYPPKLLVMESNASLRARVVDRLRGWSTAGSEYHYRYWARKDIGTVQNVSVTSPVGGLVRVAVLGNEGDGVPSEATLAQVRAQLLRDDVKVLTDTVEVVAGRRRDISVEATMYLYSDTPYRVYEELLASFPTRFRQLRLLGRDVTISWLQAQLMPSGAHSVVLTSPNADAIIDTDEFPHLANFKLTFGGRRD